MEIPWDAYISKTINNSLGQIVADLNFYLEICCINNKTYVEEKWI